MAKTSIPGLSQSSSFVLHNGKDALPIKAGQANAFKAKAGEHYGNLKKKDAEEQLLDNVVAKPTGEDAKSVDAEGTGLTLESAFIQAPVEGDEGGNQAAIEAAMPGQLAQGYQPSAQGAAGASLSEGNNLGGQVFAYAGADVLLLAQAETGIKPDVVASGAADPVVAAAGISPLGVLGIVGLGVGVAAAAGGSSAPATVVPTVDTTAPTLSITSDVAAVKVGETATITFTFSEATSNFVVGDIATSNGSVSNFTAVSSTVYTATFTPTASLASGSASITVAGGNYDDAAGNSGGAGTTPTISIDTVAPVFSSGATANFAENATGTAYDATADSDSGVTYTKSGTDASLFSINASTGLVTFATSPNYEAPADDGANNVYNLNVIATDAAGNATTQAVAITVTDVVDSLSIGNKTITEVSGENAVLTITLSQAAITNVTVNYATANDTATTNSDAFSLSAVGNSDYTSTSGTATILAGQTTTTISIPIYNDTLYEGNETFTVTLSSASSGVAIAVASATVTITDNEIDNTTAMNAVGASSFVSGANISDGIYDFTLNKPLDGILFNGWVPGVNNTLTYTFYDSGLGGAEAGVWTTVQQQAASNALQAWGNVTGVNFQYISTASAGAYTNSGADIAMFQTGSALLGGAYGAVNGFPTTNNAYGGAIYGAGMTTNEGDLLINQALDFGNSAILPGGNGWNTLVHELGHAIGLSHPGLTYQTAINYGWVGLGPGVITDANSMLYSNMSYNAALWTAGVEVGVTSPGNSVPTGYGGYWQAPDYAGSNAQYPLTTNTGQPTTAMSFDMVVASYVYGANMAYNAGNTTYTLTANTTLQTLWDPSGTDTLDASAITEAVILDLTPMAQNSSAAWFNGANINATSNTLLGGAYILPNNFTAGNFLATIIENALGGSGNDLIIGNSSSNILVGYAGNDSLTGGAGADYFTFASLSGTDTVTDFSHNDDQLVFLSSIFNTSDLTTDGAITFDQFTSGTDIQVSSNSGQIFLYDTDSGDLYYDADAAGANAAIIVATLNTSSALVFDDIQMTLQVL